MIKATDNKSTTAKTRQQPAGGSFFNKDKGADSKFLGETTTSDESFFVQRKLSIGKPDDHYEKQADQVADKVVQRMSQPAPAPVVPKATTVPAGTVPSSAVHQGAVQLKEVENKEEDIQTEEKKVQRKPIFDSMGDPPDDIQKKEAANAATPDAKTSGSNNLEQRLQQTKGGGAPLPSDTRTAMESAIGADFSGVRVHTGTEAAALSSELEAQAFTHGNDIYFNQNKFDATSSTGRHLLAHELTHTVQQGAAIQKKAAPEGERKSGDAEKLTTRDGLEDAAVQRKTGPASTGAGHTIQRAPGKAAVATPSVASGEVVDVSGGKFNPSAKLAEEIRASKHKGVEVNIGGGKIAGAGVIKVREKEGVFESLKNAYLPLNMPMFSAANPVLAVRVASGEVSGFATIGKSNAPEAIPQWLRKHGKALGWLTGIDVENVLSKATNTFENGTFTFTLNGTKVKVGGFATATMDLGFVNMKPTAHVVAEIDINGVANGSLDITLLEDKMSGEGAFAVSFKGFSGEVNAQFREGVLDVKGQVGYSGDRLSGSIMLMMTDKKTADTFAVTQLGGAPAEDAVIPEAVPAAEGKGPRGLAGMGTLTFNMTEWFAGSVNVIVDGKGCVTVVGKIAPPKEIILFQQKDYSKELFKLEARAAYGLPVIGNVFVFANVALIAMAKVGPAKIYNIEVAGTYSTNPDVAKSITLSGSLNMSAYAGLRLRAEGGAGIELAGHDIKLGVGLNADAGVKGYVDARPTIGYRDPGEFFFKGHMEIAAQPFLGLSGDLFVELDSPWWSPLPDEKWTWPIGALEYPLPGEFGIGADMEYVLGSGKVPEVSFSEAKFDGAKFMTDLVDDNVPKKGGAGEKEKPGKFVDGGATSAAPAAGTPPPAAAPGKPATGKAPGKGGAGGPGGKGKGKDKGTDKADPDQMKNFAAAMQKVKALEGHRPMTRAELTAAIEGIKKQHNTPGITFEPKGDVWMVTGVIKGKPNKQSVKVKADMKAGEDKDTKGVDKEKEKQLDLAITDVKKIDADIAGDGKMGEDEAKEVAHKAQQKHSNVFKSISVLNGGKDAKHWEYLYVQRAKDKKPVITGADKEKLNARIEKMMYGTVKVADCKKLLATATGIVGESVIEKIFEMEEEPKAFHTLLNQIITESKKEGGLKGGFRIEKDVFSTYIEFIYTGLIKQGAYVSFVKEFFIRPDNGHNIAKVINKQMFLDLHVTREIEAAGIKGVGTTMLDMAIKHYKETHKEIRAQWNANRQEYKTHYFGWSDNLAKFIELLPSMSEKEAALLTWTGRQLTRKFKYRVKDVPINIIRGDAAYFQELYDKPWKEKKPDNALNPGHPHNIRTVEVIFEPDPDAK